MNEIKKILNRAATLHQKMGAGLHAMGGYLICAPGCGERRTLLPGQIARYLRHGWPEHCGRTMQWITAKQAIAEHKAPR
jgi:hypothetical protein